MGAAIVSGPTFGNDAGGGSVTVSVPAALPGTSGAGDLLLAFVWSDNDGGPATNIVAAAGWYTVSISTDQISGLNGFAKVFTRSTTGGEPASYAWAVSNLADNMGIIWRISGWDSVTTFAAVPIWSPSSMSQ
jgi:hypothetical protein